MKSTITQNKILPALLLCSAALFAAESQAEPKVLATVNGSKVTQADIDDYRNENPKQAALPQEQLLEAMISRELLLQEAKKLKIAESSEFKKKIAELRTQLLLQSTLDRALNDNPIGEQELRAEYDRQVSQLDSTEYKARHILVKSENEAKDLIGKLDGGADFSELAMSFSTGPSGKQGGDLGWFSAKTMVPEFSAAVQQMKVGSYTKSPVQTQFGWHIIILDDTRPVTPPPYDKVKGNLQQVLQQKQISSYLMKLRSDAKIERK